MDLLADKIIKKYNVHNARDAEYTAGEELSFQDLDGNYIFLWRDRRAVTMTYVSRKASEFDALERDGAESDLMDKF